MEAIRTLTGLDGSPVEIHVQDIRPVVQPSKKTVSSDRNITKKCLTGHGAGLIEAPEQDAAADDAEPVTEAPEVITAIPVDRTPRPLSEFYAFTPMRTGRVADDAPVTYIQPWDAVQPQPEPPGDDYIKYTDEHGLTRYMFGRHRTPPGTATPAPRRDWRPLAVFIVPVLIAVALALLKGVTLP